MGPNPQYGIKDQEYYQEGCASALTGDEVVISGVSGVFPKSDNVEELMENLYNQVDMVEEVNWSAVKHPGLPKYYGKIKNMDKFDAQFFRVTHWQAATLDPLSRKIMESAFSAIYDSGTNPLTLSGTKLGVFVGSSYSDVVIMKLYDTLLQNAFVISGCSKTMLANRISYWIDAKGPSFGLDQACSGSMACLELAYNSIKRGDCEAALVGGCNSCVHPLLSLHLNIAGQTCLDGKTKCFDKNGDGCVRAEAINVIFLQKAKDAKRIYSEICHIKGKYFIRPDANFLPLRKSEDIEQFLKEFYAETNVSPSEVEYIEAYGSGIAEADGNELTAIGNFFAKSRPVKVGCVKSNMGNAESVNGLCSLTKLCIAYNKGQLPANLHYKEPQDHVRAVRDGMVQVVTENTSFKRGYAALNSFSFTGANYHVLLKGHYKIKENNRYKSSIPRLILLSGRDELGVNKVIDALKNKPIDPEQIALLHNIYKHNIPSHTGRSYTILDTNEKNETVSLARNFELYSGTPRPVWFLYTGMGSQWNCMGAELMRIPIFSAAIERCDKVLKPLGLDILKIITDSDKTIFDNILHSMVGISAMQIGLTDVLMAMGIIPDNIIGHSIGEIGCAYADGCFTAEEMILSSYNRGLISIQTPFIRGSMAAVGLGYGEIHSQCPPEIDVACHNSADSATISGPESVMKQFVSELTSRGIFAKEVACSNIAYHSRYITKGGPALLSSMKEIIKKPKLRSKKWISTSVAQENWDKDYAKYASSEYFTNNLLNPVLFEENSSLIPEGAILIEIAPHGLLQAIVKRSHSNCINIPLTKRGCADPVIFLLEAIGKLFQSGVNPKVEVLYPKVDFPVSTNTPLLSHLIEWEHSISWPQFNYESKEIKNTPARNVVISVHDDDYKYMKGYVRNGVNYVPETSLLVFVWETYAMYWGKYYKNMPITFYDVIFHCQLKIEAEDILRLRITVQNGSNRFEIVNGNTEIVTGFVKNIASPIRLTKDAKQTQDIDSYSEHVLNRQDFYTFLRMKGYSYSDDFQCIQSLTTSNTAYIKWNDEWATFLDSLIQLNAFGKDHNGVSTPKLINKLSINVREHNNYLTTKIEDGECYTAEIINCSEVRCGGVLLEGVIFDDKPRLEKMPDVLLTKKFVPHICKENVNLDTAVFLNLQLVTDNVENTDIKVSELVTSDSESISKVIGEISEKFPSYYFDIKYYAVENNNFDKHEISNSTLLVTHNLLGNKTMINVLKRVLKEETFVLTLEQNLSQVQDTEFKIITVIPVNKGALVLLKKCVKYNRENVTYITIDEVNTFSWLSRVKSELQKTKRVVLVSERQPYSGIIGFVKHLRKYTRNKIGLIEVNDYNSSSFNPDNDFFKEQLDTNLSISVLRKGQWGSYYYTTPNSLSVKTQNLCLTNSSVGDFDSFTWIEAPKQSENPIKVRYAGISAKDCENVLVSDSNKKLTFGMDFSGVDSRGERVMGMIVGGAVSNTVEADETLLWPVPQHWSLEDAATVPLPYVQAYYCLALKGRIKRNQTVFVTGGTGALGQAVIAVCQSLDYTVYTTVSNETKKIFLMKLFPKLKDENVCLSRHDSFYTNLKNVTNNEGCDIVINCCTGPLRKAGMKCVAFMGRFIDVSTADMDANMMFRMSYLVKGRHYVPANVSSLFRPENLNDRKALQIMIAEGIANGTVRPLSRVVFSPLEVSRAFKLVSSSRHRGRALIKICDSALLSSNIDVIPRMTYSDGVHVVVLDKTNIGVELINHLIRKGANKIVINMKKNTETSYINANAVLWKKLDVTIEFNWENLQANEGCERLLKAARKLGSVTSIFIVQDYEDIDNNDDIQQKHLKSSFDDIVLLTANLDKVSRNCCDGLSYFTLLSVFPQNIGNEYATSACEKICNAREIVGLPALVLRADITDQIKINGSTLLSTLELSTLSSLFNAMDISLKLKLNNALTFNSTKKSTFGHYKKLESILGVKNINDVNENQTLYDLMYANDLILEEIKSELPLVNITNEELLTMTIASIKHQFQYFQKRSTDFNAGLGAFYRDIDKNEYRAVDAIVPMKTKLMNFEEDGYIDRSVDHLMMIPGFDGHHHVFKPVAERLKIQAVTLQLGPDLICDSIPEMANILANHIKSHFEKSSKFHILGYSFGVNVALEVAKILEAEGRTGVVYCLDSSPDALKSQFEAYTGILTYEQLQNNILAHMYHLMTGQEDIILKQKLEVTDNWSDKIEICMKKLRDLVHFSNEHRRSILESAYKRILLAREYKPDLNLESQLVLIKGIPHPRAENLADDYNLSKYTKQPVKVFDIKSDHASAPYDCRVSNIVNKLLDPHLLEEFKRKNICEYYYI